MTSSITPMSEHRGHPATRALAVVAALAITIAAGSAIAADVVLVAHPAVGVSEMNRKDVERIFLRRLSTLPSGERARPVDQTATSAARRDFCEQVLKRSSQDVDSYWNAQVFSGKAAPPPTVASDQAVVEYVRTNPGAVGYVSPGASTTGVKVIRILD